MFVPQVVVPRQRGDGKRTSPRDRTAKALVAMVAGIGGAVVSVLSKRPHATAAHGGDGAVVGVCVIVGLACVAGFVIARAIGRQSKA